MFFTNHFSLVSIVKNAMKKGGVELRVSKEDLENVLDKKADFFDSYTTAILTQDDCMLMVDEKKPFFDESSSMCEAGMVVPVRVANGYSTYDVNLRDIFDDYGSDITMELRKSAESKLSIYTENGETKSIPLSLETENGYMPI